MRTIVATATTKEEATEILNAIYTREPFIVWADINELQVTAIYETQAEVDERQEREYQQSVKQTQALLNEVEATAKSQPKTRKRPTPQELTAKAEKLFLDNLLVARVGKEWRIVVAYGKNCDEVLYTCKTPTGISRQLTKIHWDKQIARLQADGLIAS